MKTGVPQFFALLAAAVWTVHAGDEKFILTTDPFRKPALKELARPEPLVLGEEHAVVAVPRLRAIMRSPLTTVVNLDGELIAVGGRFENFQVVAAGERDVVLLQGDESFVVSLDDERHENQGRE